VADVPPSPSQLRTQAWALISASDSHSGLAAAAGAAGAAAPPPDGSGAFSARRTEAMRW